MIRDLARTRPFLFGALMVSVLALSACGGSGGNAVTPDAPATPVTPSTSLDLSAGKRLLPGGGGAVALGASTSATWQLAAGSPGSLSASSGGSISYLPPSAAVSAITPVTITATAGGLSGTLHLALYPDPGTPGLALLAGSLGEYTIFDGTGTAARFNDIVGVAAAGANLLVADRGDVNTDAASYQQGASFIRRVTAAGAVTTLSRLPLGHADGDAAHARMGEVFSLAPGAGNSVYTLEFFDGVQSIRLLSADGSVATLAILAADGGDASRLLTAPGGTGPLYAVAQSHISRVNTDGSLTLLAGSPTANGSTDGVGAAARFTLIADAALDAIGNLYVIDGNSVRKITPAGAVSTLASGTGANAINAPTSIAIDGDNNVLLLDRAAGSAGGRDIVRQISSTGAVTTLYTINYAGTGGSVTHVLPDTGETGLLHIGADGAPIVTSKGQLLAIGASGQATVFAGLENGSDTEVDGPVASARFTNPLALAGDFSGNIFVLDYLFTASGLHQNGTSKVALRKIGPAGTVSTVFSGDADTPTGMQVDSSGNIFISYRPVSTAPPAGGDIYKITPEGTATLFAGAAGQPATVDGQGATARFTSPTLSGIDAADNLYVTDTNGAQTVFRKITPQGLVSTIPSLPTGLNTAPDGNVYTADSVQQTVTRITPAGVSSVVAGAARQRATVLGALPGSLDTPRALVPTGPGSFALVSGNAVLRLVVPH